MRLMKEGKAPTWVRLMKNQPTASGDPLDELANKIGNADKPQLEEVSLHHPFNTSTVKIRNNGMIDMSTGTNQLIRVDPETKTINEITGTLKQHLGDFRAWISNSAQWWAKKEICFTSEESFFKVKAYEEVILHAYGPSANMKLLAEGDIDIKAKGDIRINGKEVYINS